MIPGLIRLGVEQPSVVGVLPGGQGPCLACLLLHWIAGETPQDVVQDSSGGREADDLGAFPTILTLSS